MRTLAATFALALCSVTGIASASAADDVPAVTALLAQSARAWNQGNLDAFMSGYEHARATVYISRKGVIRGYDAIRAHYAARYKKSGMGVLSFSDLSLRSLGDDYAVVLANFHLALSGGAHPTGAFSLIVHRSASGWHIIEDCTP